MKRGIAIILALCLAITTGYLFLRFRVLKAKDFKPDVRKEKTALDLRPAVIAKLQQLVRDGSAGLYLLTIDTLDPDVIGSRVKARNIRLQVDSGGYRQLAQKHRLPDDIFDIRCAALQIDGIGINDLLHKNRIDIKGISMTDPVIGVHHKAQPYNAAEREALKKQTLYQRFIGQMDRIAIGRVTIIRGTFNTYNAEKGRNVSSFKNVSIRMDDILIDSSTQFDNSRFLFAKNANLETKDYILPSPDSLYEFRIGTISVSGNRHEVTALNVGLVPRGGKDAFLKRIRTRKELFTCTFPKITLSGIEWWAMVNGEGLLARQAEMTGGAVDVFLDKSKPIGPAGRKDNFPHQKLMKIPFPVSVQEILLHHVNVSYGEFNPDAGQSGTVRFTGIEGRLDHVSNIPSEIAVHPVTTMSVKAVFMKQTPMNCFFRLDMARHKTGAFLVDGQMGALDHEDVNTFAAPLALISMPTGRLQQGTIHMAGNNDGIKGTVSLRYTDLRIDPLKEKSNGELKKKKLTSLLANIILIKNQNPGRDGELRQPDIAISRTPHSNFFNLIWVGMKSGMLKTIGVPQRMAKMGP